MTGRRIQDRRDDGTFDEPLNRIVTENVRRLMNAQGLSAADIVRSTHGTIDSATMSKLLANRRLWQPTHIRVVSEILRVRSSALLRSTDGDQELGTCQIGSVAVDESRWLDALRRRDLAFVMTVAAEIAGELQALRES